MDRYSFRIVHDEENPNSRFSCENDWTFYTADLPTEKSTKEGVQTIRGKWFSPLYLLRHSGEVVSRFPFDDERDSWCCGFAVCPKDRFESEKQALLALDDEIEVFNQSLSGDVWAVILKDEATGEEKYVTGGIFGEEEAKIIGGLLVEKSEKEHAKKMSSNYEEA